MLITQKAGLKNILYILVFLLPLTTTKVVAQSDKILLANEYYNTGEFEKALDIYSELARRSRNIPQIHSYYFELLLTQGKFSEAEKYINKVIQNYPNSVIYMIDKGMIYQSQGKEDLADKDFKKVIEGVKKGNFNIRTTAQYFMRKRISEYAIETFNVGRKKEGNKFAYALELANVYRVTNNKNMMVEEYLNFIKEQPQNLDFVKNTFQNLLTEKEDLLSMENMLFDKIQEEPNENIYSDLMIWVNLQMKNFYGAFVQSRAFDKRFDTGGSRTMDVGIIAFENKDYKNSIKIFEYVLKEYTESEGYVMARRYVIRAREEMVKNTYPVDTVEISKLIADYDLLVRQAGINNVTLQVMRSQALLYAFYLDNKRKAIDMLNNILKVPRVNSNLIAQCKLDLGDIYLLISEPWESTLLYSQVEKAKKEQPLGYEAKLRNAKLSYYTGNFSLAQSHLDILKLATSRQISNDAIQLSLIIKDNTILDTTDLAMQKYASADLLLFQNKKQEALDILDQILSDNSGHSLTDEIYWLKGKIYMELGRFEESIELLHKIVNEYPYDILSDDAYFLMGTIYEDQLKNTEKAQEIYQDFLVKYPGSIFTSEARKRFRLLRGDLIN